MDGKFTVEGDKLTFETTAGECAGDNKTGSYKSSSARSGSVSSEAEDACEWRLSRRSDAVREGVLARRDLALSGEVDGRRAAAAHASRA
jgi:hypothetical protein